MALEFAHASMRCDVLYVCTRLAADAVDAMTREVGTLECSRKFPVVCHPDDFVRVTSLDRNVDGSAAWYCQPVFNPAPSDTFTAFRLSEVCEALVLHRRQWLEKRNVLRMMFSMARVTGLQLHEVAMPRQTVLADALIEMTWMRSPLDLDPPRPVRGAVVHGVGEKFKGASVLDAVKGLHIGTIYMPDVGSLYPNVVREYLSKEYPLYARLFETMIAERAGESDALHATALKVITNSVFGSRKHGRMPDQHLAELITEHGRRVQALSLEALAQLSPDNYAVIAGDTDSLALWVAPHIPISDVVTILNGDRRFALYKSAVDSFSAVFFVNNKSWAGLCARSDEIVTRGLMQNRSTTPRFVLESHREWTAKVLRNREFATSTPVQREWVKTRADWLRAQPWSVTDLACFAKPTREHPETDRAYVVLTLTNEHVPLADYVSPGRRWPPVDVEYLVKIYFLDELERHIACLAGGPLIR